MAKKTWKEKLEKSKDPYVKFIDFQFADIPSNSHMLISSPKEIKEFIENIPRGEKMDITRLREELAKKHKADYTCPVTTAIYLRIVAENALEDLRNGIGISAINPFWRVIEPGSKFWKKLDINPGEEEVIKTLR